MTETRIVTLAGKAYPVPNLVPRQQREILPALVRIANAVKHTPDGLRSFLDITTPVYDDMLNVVFWGVVWPNNKQSNVGTIMEADISFEDLSAAINVVREASGMFKRAQEGATPGESAPASAN